jgi:hypothetical protein
VLVLVVIPYRSQPGDRTSPNRRQPLPSHSGELALSIKDARRALISPIVLGLVVVIVLVPHPVIWCQSLSLVAFVHACCPRVMRFCPATSKLDKDDGRARFGERCSSHRARAGCDSLPQPGNRTSPNRRQPLPSHLGELALSIKDCRRALISPIVLVLVVVIVLVPLPVIWCQSLSVVAFVHVCCPRVMRFCPAKSKAR